MDGFFYYVNFGVCVCVCVPELRIVEIVSKNFSHFALAVCEIKVFSGYIIFIFVSIQFDDTIYFGFIFKFISAYRLCRFATEFAQYIHSNWIASSSYTSRCVVSVSMVEDQLSPYFPHLLKPLPIQYSVFKDCKSLYRLVMQASGVWIFF